MIDDGSTENIWIFKHLSSFESISVIRHDANKGKGAAIKTGINIKTSNAIIKNFIKFGFAKAIVDLKLEQIKRRKYRIA